MCLCGLLGAEIGYLPGPVADEAKRFFESNIIWLTRVFERASGRTDISQSRGQALRTIATLEGALILARSLDDPAAFDVATKGLAPQ